MRIRLYPNIYIHCWGGLGSQLFAWILMAETKEKFKHRRVKLVMHESGITLRKSEISSFQEEFFDSDDSNNFVWCYIPNFFRAFLGIKINSLIPKSH